MKQWMIWAGAGILGVTLAAILIPWVGVGLMPVEPMPEVETTVRTPRMSASEEITPEIPADTVQAPIETAPESHQGTPPPAVTASTPPSVDGDIEEFQNPAREDRAARLKEPDMVAAIHLNSRWREINFKLRQMPEDPAGAGALERVDGLQRDFRMYRRNPDAVDIEELMARQDSIVGELRQTSYWGPEMARMVQDMQAATNTYHDTK